MRSMLLVLALIGVIVGCRSSSPDREPGIEGAQQPVTASGGEGFVATGELVQGVECVLFSSDEDGVYVLDELGDFKVGDRVLVNGRLDPGCMTTCMQGSGCIRDNTIESAE